MDDSIGKQFGNYRLIRRLGHGGFGDVYLGQHLHLARYAAIKVIHAHLTRWGEEAFRAEAQRLVDLEHPHIVRIFDFGLEAGISYLVMEYAPNGSLRERHPSGSRLPLGTIVFYVKHLADALQYVHERKLIHRDIKPANVLLGSKNNLLLSDVGLAIASHSVDSFSQQQIAGTPAYMAPEQAQGMAVPASDQYSLGVMVYEWLCGELPFISSNRDGKGVQKELEELHRYVPPPTLRQKISTISPALEAVILRALAKDPQERFGNVQEFSRTLEQAGQLNSLASSVAPFPSSKSSSRIDLIIPQSQSSLPIQAIAQPGPSSQPTVMAKVPITPVGSASSRKRSGIRSPLLIGLALLILLIGSVGLYNLARTDSTTGVNHIATPTATPTTAPTATPTATPTIAPTATPTATPTTAPTATPTATPTPIDLQNPYPPHRGTLVLNDPLSDNSQGHNWDQSPQIPNCVFTSGAYHISENQQGHFNDCFARGISFSNIAYEVQMTIVQSDSSASGGGIIFRSVNDPNTLFYAFTINLDGSYTLFAQGSSRATNRLLAGGSTPAIHNGLNQTNVVAAVTNGSTISLYVNKQFIVSLTDTTYSAGDIGLFANDAGTLVEAVFSNAKVWTL